MKMKTASLLQDSFRAMNTDITVALADEEPCAGAETAFRETRSWFAYAEGVFSRFRPDSELGGLNLSAGLPVRISRTMEEVLALAVHYRKLTDGCFDPGILPSLIQAGYSVSFEQIGRKSDGASRASPVPRAAATAPTPAPVKAGWQLFGPLRAVRLDKETQLDLGGIVKGWAVDRIADRIVRRGLPAGIVNAGGDLRVWSDPKSPGWKIEIADPFGRDAALGLVVLRTGAVATSSVLGRGWNTPDGRKHHLIDPRTGQPADSDVWQCSVVGTKTADAEIAAKTVCLMGKREGAKWLKRTFPLCDALVLTRDNRTHLIRGDGDEFAEWRLKGE